MKCRQLSQISNIWSLKNALKPLCSNLFIKITETKYFEGGYSFFKLEGQLF